MRLTSDAEEAAKFLGGPLDYLERGDYPRIKVPRKKVVRLGIVTKNPGKRLAFQNLKTYLAGRGYPVEIVNFESYDKLVDGLDNRQVDIAWNSPLAHAQYHIRNECSSRTLAMREGDVDLHLAIIARKGSGIASISDLKGKRLVVENAGYQNSILAEQFVKDSGLGPGQVEIVYVKGRQSPAAPHRRQG